MMTNRRTFLGVLVAALLTSGSAFAQQPRLAGFTTITTTTTGTQDNFAPGLNGDTIIRCNNATVLTIDGLAGGYSGQHVFIFSVGAGPVNLAHQAGGSTAANRIINFVTSNVTPLAAGLGVAELVYDATMARWKLVTHEQGGWIAWVPTDASGAALSLTVNNAQYWVRGRQVFLNVRVTYPANADGTAAALSGLPFTPSDANMFSTIFQSNPQVGAFAAIQSGLTTIILVTPLMVNVTNTQVSNDQISFNGYYQIL